MAESNHDLPRLENPQTSNHFSKRAVMHTSMTAHQNVAMDFAPRTRLASDVGMLSSDVAISIDSGFATFALLFVLDFAVLGFWIG
ncbi:hypothetical protein ELG88_34980 (plasmid) [Rhizobium leguminosarum]|uniref:hypothetical protein n=1 Tax=Rhizobium leguminosarum TaxID=384 RepID=UPI001030D03A|nr:hypothetical protein [Rhizobium leguminosarum]TBF23933.1 hypothetical protein ELG88_34980 [Rhizobium leguminosarum]